MSQRQGACMSDDRSRPATVTSATRGAAISRRDFNTVLGLGAVGTASAPGRCRRRRSRAAGTVARAGTVRDDGGGARRSAAPQAGVGPRGDDRASHADGARESPRQRHRHARRRAGDDQRGQGRRRDGTARDARRAPRPAGGAQGPAGYRRHPHHPRLALLQGQHPHPRRADRDAHARGRRHHGGQDQHAGVRRRVADVQRRLRCDP